MDVQAYITAAGADGYVFFVTIIELVLANGYPQNKPLVKISPGIIRKN